MRPVVRRVAATSAAVVVLAVAGLGFHRARAKADALERQVGSERRIPVTCEPAHRREFREAVRLAGNIQCKDDALVSARIPGTLEVIFVDEGDGVIAGETRLFQTDHVKLAKEVEVKRRELAVAQSNLLEKQASLECSRADLEKAEFDWNRQQDLHLRAAASKVELVWAEKENKRCASMVKHSEALAAVAEAQVEQARSLLAIAQKDLDDSLVVAPITGVVSERRLEPGEMASAGTVVLHIEDPSVLEITCHVPSRYYDRVKVGTTPMHFEGNGARGVAKVSYVSPTIKADMRTFEVRCVVSDPSSGLVPGAMAQIELVLRQHEGLGIPRDAVMDRATGRIVFVVDGERARQVSVTTGLTTDGYVEILDAPLPPEARVVTMGQFLLRDGSGVKVVEDK
ncbi:MAG: efflux RND transporter periplasmic adaptor subunit [Phycisphaerae bacterium]|nr:efflux RND transporter periplasmic adaptor subunit [Phycisphaerae bacterium]